MRDTRKSSSYFEQFIEYETARIQKWKEKLENTSDTTKQQTIEVFLLNSQMREMIASFSYSADVDSLANKLNDIVATVKDLPKLTYDTQLRILSFSIMLNKKDIANQIDSNKLSLEDKLIQALWYYISTDTLIWQGSFIFPSFGELDDVFRTKSENALLKYLDGWYENNSDASWYDNDKSDNDVYEGYWSFESAAIAKMLEMNEDLLEKNVFYPKL